MKTSEIDFHLPRELVTYGPTPFRGDARLMVLDRKMGNISYHHFSELESLLYGYEVWVNDLKLLRGRIKLWRDTGHVADVTLMRRTGAPGRWIAQICAAYDILNERRYWKTEDGIKCKIIGRPEVDNEGDQWEIEFEKELDLEKIGKICLPPWVRQPENREQEKWYEPIYAARGEGLFSPSAGINITEELEKSLYLKKLTLHLNFDHIRSIETDTLEEHGAKLKPERYEILGDAPSDTKPTCAIGTTTMKALETYARTWMMDGESDLFISPPFEFQIVKAFITNFHLPRESLLALTCAFGGTDAVMGAYHEAIREKYRWSDYGDSFLVI